MTITMPAVSSKKGRMGDNSSNRSDVFLPAINSRGSTTASESDGSPVATYHSPESSHRATDLSTFRLPNIDDRSKNVSAASNSSMNFHLSRFKERNGLQDNHRSSTNSSFVNSRCDSDSDEDILDGKENSKVHNSSGINNIETRLPSIFKSAVQKQDGVADGDQEIQARKSDNFYQSIERGRTYIALLDRLDRTPRAELTGNLHGTPRPNVTPSTPHQAALLLPMRHEESRKKKRKQDSNRGKEKKEHSSVKDSKNTPKSAEVVNNEKLESSNDESVLNSHHGMKVKTSPKQQNYNNILKDKDPSPRSAAPHIRA